MSFMGNKQKELIFDYCIGITSQEQSEEALQLIANNKEASELYSKIKASLSPLGSVEPQVCPDDLLERTMLRINNTAVPNRELTELLKAEQNKKSPIKIGFLRNFTEVAAVAAAIILITGILIPAFGFARQKYYQQQCGFGMNNVFNGFSNFMTDNDDNPPKVERAEGAPWWKVGNEDESNTVHMYMLVANGYVDPGEFICPSQKNKSRNFKTSFKIYKAKCTSYKDFPDRKFVSYSFPILCQKESDGKMSCRKVLMADRNPVFENLPADYSAPLTIELRKELLKKNSPNHNNRGQNILFGDGRVEFNKDRQVDHDDVYTLEYTDVYFGYETPSCTTDLFLVP